MFTPEEMRNVVALMRAGLKTMELDGNQMIVVGVLMKKCEDMMKPEQKKSTETKPKEDIVEKPADTKKKK